MSDDGRWLRATLDPDPVPPPDLAARAVHTARRIRRRRFAAGAVAALAVVAVPLAAVRTGPGQQAAGPAPTSPALPTCAGSSRPPFVPARSATDVSWPYRGDAGLRTAAVRAGAGLTDVRPLFGARLDDGHTVVAAAGWSGSAWELRWRTDSGAGASAHLPVLGPRTQLSIVLPAGLRSDGIVGTLVVLAPPGTTEIAFVSCPRLDGSGRYTDPGDTAVLPLKPGSLAGHGADPHPGRDRRTRSPGGSVVGAELTTG
jgi:hypothetical protein